MRAFYRPFILEDFLAVLEMDLRQSDREEIEAATGWHWKTALQFSLQYSTRAWVIIYDNKIEAVFGLSEENPHVGVPWLVATTKFAGFSFRVARESKAVIKLMLDVFPTLSNYVSAKHFESIRWLKWCGFTLAEDYTYLHDPRIPFIKFSMRRQ
jgi:hypothetical protein